MSLKITPGSIESDGHVVLLPAGLTGTVETADGTVYDLGAASEVAIEVGSHEHAKEVALAASDLAGESDALPDVTHDRKQSTSNFKGA